MAQSDYRRPILLSIIAILSIIGGLLVCLIGVFSIIGGGFLALGEGGELESALSLGATTMGGLLLIMGLLVIVVGVGLFSGRAWAWWLTVIVYGLGVVLGLYQLVMGDTSGLFGLLFAVLVLLYMNSKNTKGWFGI